MMLWLLLIALTLVVLLLLLRPLVGARSATPPRIAYDLEVYQEQLRELDRDVAAGTLGPAEAGAARLEVERRMLAALKEPAESTPLPSAAPRPSLVAAGLLAVALPAFALGLYASRGAPTLSDQPLAARVPGGATVAGQGMPADMDSAIAGLKERLAREPGNVEGWLLLGRSLAVLGRWAEGAQALQGGLAPTARDPELAAMLAEHQTFAADGAVTAAAQALFVEVLLRRPEHPGARFYLALARYQGGDKATALAAWSELAARLSPETPWLPALRQRIAATAAEVGVAVPKIAAAPAPEPVVQPAAPAAPGPTQADVQAAQQMSEADRAQMIQGMVARLTDRLRENPEDIDGWRRLARAQAVLGERSKARDAFAEAARRVPGEVALQADYANAIVIAAADPEQVPGEAVAQYRRVLDLDNRHPAALWHLGLAEAQAGNPEAARSYWERLLAALPPGGQDARAVQSSLDRLKSLQ
ncbi:MAG: c-type cytochrome biogenesis protein CcmI [Alphaproteobacteria bacterium]|nr:c-type cytochrome biogenesis protein CcmI [Alphaproteobacteria bacterium]